MKPLLAKISFLTGILIAISSCEKDSCKKVTCPVDTECSHGACICPDGYEGTNCDTLSYKKYIGNYRVSESCTSGNSVYSGYVVTITWGGGADSNLVAQLILDPLFETAPVDAYIYNIPGSLGLNLNIPAQSLNSGLFVISASTGAVNYNSQTNAVSSIELFLNYTYQEQTYTCTEFLTKF